MATCSVSRVEYALSCQGGRRTVTITCPVIEEQPKDALQWLETDADQYNKVDKACGWFRGGHDLKTPPDELLADLKKQLGGQWSYGLTKTANGGGFGKICPKECPKAGPALTSTSCTAQPGGKKFKNREFIFVVITEWPCKPEAAGDNGDSNGVNIGPGTGNTSSVKITPAPCPPTNDDGKIEVTVTLREGGEEVADALAQEAFDEVLKVYGKLCPSERCALELAGEGGAAKTPKKDPPVGESPGSRTASGKTYTYVTTFACRVSLTDQGRLPGTPGGATMSDSGASGVGLLGDNGPYEHKSFPDAVADLREIARIVFGGA